MLEFEEPLSLFPTDHFAIFDNDALLARYV